MTFQNGHSISVVFGLVIGGLSAAGLAALLSAAAGVAATGRIVDVLDPVAYAVSALVIKAAYVVAASIPGPDELLTSIRRERFGRNDLRTRRAGTSADVFASYYDASVWWPLEYGGSCAFVHHRGLALLLMCHGRAKEARLWSIDPHM